MAGGTLLRGILSLGDEIEIRPGYIRRDAHGRDGCTPIVSRIVSLHAEKNELRFAVPGGLIGVGTNVDPTATRGDRLVGNVLGLRGQLPDIYVRLVVQTNDDIIANLQFFSICGCVWRFWGWLYFIIQ